MHTRQFFNSKSYFHPPKFKLATINGHINPSLVSATLVFINWILFDLFTLRSI